MNTNTLKSYWRNNLAYLAVLLIIWALISYGLGIVWVDDLNQFKWRGFKLGFWFAQQGSIYGFLVIIFTYVGLMNRLDKKYNLEEE